MLQEERMEHDEFAEYQFDKYEAPCDHLGHLDAAVWQRIWPWEPPTIDLYSPLKPKEMLVQGNLSPDFWQRLPSGEKLARLGEEKQMSLRPAWWQRLFWRMSRPKPATDKEIIAGWKRMLRSSLKPAWWQRLFQRMPKLPS